MSREASWAAPSPLQSPFHTSAIALHPRRHSAWTSATFRSGLRSAKGETGGTGGRGARARDGFVPSATCCILPRLLPLFLRPHVSLFRGRRPRPPIDAAGLGGGVAAMTERHDERSDASTASRTVYVEDIWEDMLRSITDNIEHVAARTAADGRPSRTTATSVSPGSRARGSARHRDRDAARPNRTPPPSGSRAPGPATAHPERHVHRAHRQNPARRVRAHGKAASDSDVEEVPGYKTTKTDCDDAVAKDGEPTCCICRANRTQMICPCGHACLCFSCARIVIDGDHLCPICRRPFVGPLHRLYIS